jgi:predicted Zn-dependent protease
MRHLAASSVGAAVPPGARGLSRRRRVALVLLASLLLVAALAGATPAAAQKVSNPELFGKSLAAAEEALAHYGTWDDEAALSRVNDIGYQVAAASGFQRFPFSFYLADMREPNAFALPGGHIFVTRGMLELGLDDDQLAALLGHEIAHVTLEHGLKMQRRATLLNVLSSAVLVGVILAEKGGGSDVPPGIPRYGAGAEATSGAERIQGAAAASLILAELLLRSYNREFEDQADEEGQRFAAGAGFSPRGGAMLFALMADRLPQSRDYGYWRTHPFFADRVGAAEARGRLLRSQEPKPTDAFRTATQAALLEYDPRGVDKGAERSTERGAEKEEALRLLLAETALTAWPQGEQADRLRLEALHRLRDEELARLELERNYDRVLRAYDQELAAVRSLTPQSAFVSTAEAEARALRESASELYPKAQQVVAEGVYQTAFLEAFLANHPQAPEAPRLAFELAGAYARQGKQAEAVDRYLEAWKADPQGAVGERALAGLRSLATVVDDLSALQQLAAEVTDPELQRVTGERLAQMAGNYQQLANGAEYLRRYPSGAVAGPVAEHLDSLAEKLYGEVVLYRGVGDSMKALDRIQQILTHAPLSPAAERLRERAVLEG